MPEMHRFSAPFRARARRRSRPATGALPPGSDGPLPKAARASEVGVSSARLERLTTEPRRYVADGKLPGGVVLVARRGKVVASRRWAEDARPSTDARGLDFRIASQTKAVVSVVALVLQEEGRLLLSDPVSRYLPEFRETTVAAPKPERGYDVVKAKRQITIRDLLTHTSASATAGGPRRTGGRRPASRAGTSRTGTSSIGTP